ncbi:hypothetical protein CEXT_517581 [Caerostris extrusa]|uniref:Uncharacterized protein n=1 Tax=Caerostris extrusa TaxID=172846 RepID=A0AAV4NWG8_CAEEX|nr:hypothetical protein CEXT_517581 [Caerostris extrusa]
MTLNWFSWQQLQLQSGRSVDDSGPQAILMGTGELREGNQRLRKKKLERWNLKGNSSRMKSLMHLSENLNWWCPWPAVRQVAITRGEKFWRLVLFFFSRITLMADSRCSRSQKTDQPLIKAIRKETR